MRNEGVFDAKLNGLHTSLHLAHARLWPMHDWHMGDCRAWTACQNWRFELTPSGLHLSRRLPDGGLADGGFVI